MLVIHIVWLTVGNHANWLEVHLLRLPCGRSSCSLSFFSQKLIFVNVISRESPVPSRGEVFPKIIYFFSGLRGSRVFLSSFLILGLIFQSGNLHLDPASTWHRLGIYISHKRLFFFTCIYQTPDSNAQQNPGWFFLCESQAPQFQLPKIELPPENLYFSTGFLISANSRRLPAAMYGCVSCSLHKGQMELKSSLHTAQVAHCGTVFTKRTCFPKCIKIPHG